MSHDSFEIPVPHVSDTAWLVAELRAIESERPDAHFHDPLARKLLGEKGKEILSHFGPGIRWDFVMSVRTKLIDDIIVAKVRAGVDTVINLAAGLDTRPYRLDLPSQLNWIEADYRAVTDYKNEVLRDERPTCQLVRHGVDLANDDERAALLRDVDATAGEALVLTEGLLYYLTEENVTALAGDLYAQPSVRYWLIDFLDRSFTQWMREHFQAAPAAGDKTAFRFFPDDMIAFAENLGWKNRAFHSYAIEAARLNRLPPAPWSGNTLRLQENSGVALFEKIEASL